MMTPGDKDMAMRAIGWTAMIMLAGALPAGADVKAGVDAWARGDFRAAVGEWRGPAVAGDADAQFNLGQAYKLGRGVPLDPALAESWFRKAALQGHLQAEDNYGLALFQAGRKTDAVPWLEKSVARAEPRAQLVLGTMLFNGDGIGRDYPRAYALMTLASQGGLKSASETLAQMDQYVSPQDRERGLALARQAPARTQVVAAPPTPAPAPRPAPAIATTPKRAAPAPAQQATATGWRVQLGAFRDRSNAEALWARVAPRLASAQPAYPTTAGVTRLQATGYSNRAAATRACQASGVTCVVVAP